MNTHIASAQSVKIRKILDMIALNQSIINRSIELRWDEDEAVRNYHRIVINNRKLIDKRLIKYCKSQIRKLYVYATNI